MKPGLMVLRVASFFLSNHYYSTALLIEQELNRKKVGFRKTTTLPGR